MLCKHGEMKGEKREGCETQVCNRVTCKDYERKECIHGGKEMVKEQYSSANTHMDQRLGHGRGHSSQET